jgi:hypothetical protein
LRVVAIHASRYRHASRLLRKQIRLAPAGPP